MRISDWSSDVCSSDLRMDVDLAADGLGDAFEAVGHEVAAACDWAIAVLSALAAGHCAGTRGRLPLGAAGTCLWVHGQGRRSGQLGRASGRAGVCQDV